MAFPKFLRKLYQNDGAGPLVRQEILPPAKKIELSLDMSSGISKDQIVAVPAYTVGYCTLNVYINGARCDRGDTYSEVGDDGTTSTSIKFNDAIASDYSVTVIVG